MVCDMCGYVLEVHNEKMLAPGCTRWLMCGCWLTGSLLLRRSASFSFSHICRLRRFPSLRSSLTGGYHSLDRGPARLYIASHIAIHFASALTLSYHPLPQQEKCRQMDIVHMCRRQYLRALSLTHVCDSPFPTSLVGFFSWFPGLRRLIGAHIVRFSTAVDDSDLQLALSPAQTAVQTFCKYDAINLRKYNYVMITPR